MLTCRKDLVCKEPSAKVQPCYCLEACASRKEDLESLDCNCGGVEVAGASASASCAAAAGRARAEQLAPRQSSPSPALLEENAVLVFRYNSCSVTSGWTLGHDSASRKLPDSACDGAANVQHVRGKQRRACLRDVQDVAL
jgi:hypothetical protein